jgi:hypothetical protein
LKIVAVAEQNALSDYPDDEASARHHRKPPTPLTAPGKTIERNEREQANNYEQNQSGTR